MKALLVVFVGKVTEDSLHQPDHTHAELSKVKVWKEKGG
jgi:hypothetical protein